MDDRLLIKSCLQGDSKAQKQLYDLFVNKMFRLCYRYISNQFDAEDVMIVGFQKVFKHLGTFEYRETGSLEKWIKTIMINESLMFLRRAHKFEIISVDEIKQDECAEWNTTNTDAEIIYRHITELPPGYRTVLNLYILDGLTHEEISEKLNISINTSKSQLSRARAILKKQLLKYEWDGQKI